MEGLKRSSHLRHKLKILVLHLWCSGINSQLLHPNRFYSPGVVMSEKSKLCSCNCRVKTTVKVSKKEFNSKNNFKCINSLHFTKVIV